MTLTYLQGHSGKSVANAVLALALHGLSTGGPKGYEHWQCNSNLSVDTDNDQVGMLTNAIWHTDWEAVGHVTVFCQGHLAIVMIVHYSFHDFPFLIACALFLWMANVTWYKEFEL